MTFFNKIELIVKYNSIKFLKKTPNKQINKRKKNIKKINKPIAICKHTMI